MGELSEYLGVSKWMIYKYIQNREIPFIPYGRIIRFDRLAIDRWAEKRAVRSFRSVRLRRQSADWIEAGGPADIFLDGPDEPLDLEVRWSRIVPSPLACQIS
ncbi:MAG TPA: helix-turn-helix domain-containing protein [Elusimicrobiota bacterium]|nr:helix-turn-helix domain-containing protein [Elusimicrobiota bacterium]